MADWWVVHEIFFEMHRPSCPRGMSAREAFA
jgi:hypothetical protein